MAVCRKKIDPLTSMSPKPFIRLHAVEKGWMIGTEKFPVLHNIYLDVFLNQSIAVVGPSGSGKSTLLHILGLLTPIDSGSLQFADRDVTSYGASQRQAIRLNIGYIFQDSKLIPNLNVIENVAIPLLHRGVWPSKQKEQAALALERVGLGHRFTHKPNQLSGGELMRVAIARALVLQPKIILADEPTGTLDSRNGQIVADLLYKLVTPETALVMVTHHMPLAERADRILRIQDGFLSEDMQISKAAFHRADA
jgi:putative ABC transport system ATP-binding protein